MRPYWPLLLVVVGFTAGIGLWFLRTPREISRKQAQSRVTSDVDAADVKDTMVLRVQVAGWIFVFGSSVAAFLMLSPLVALASTGGIWVLAIVVALSN